MALESMNIKLLLGLTQIKGGLGAQLSFVVFTFSHIGLAIEDVDASGYVKTVEGNTNGAGSREGGSVLEKRRHVSKIRSRIRIF